MNLPDTWVSVPLSTLVVDMQPGFAQRPDSVQANTLQLRTNNVSRNGSIDLSEVKSVYATEEDIEKYGVRSGDIIFNNTNSPELVGKTAFFDLDQVFVISNHMTRIRVDKTITDSEYVARYLHYLWTVGFTSRVAKQWVSQAAIDQANLSRFQIILPTLPEQQRIVAILRQADALRRERQKIVSLTRQLQPSSFFETFLAKEQTKTFSLEKVTRFTTSGSRWWSKYYSATGAKFIRVQNVLAGELNLDDLAFVQPPVNDVETNRTAIQADDLLITITGSIGRVAVAPVDLGEAYVSQHVAIVRLDGSIHPYYIADYLNHPAGGQIQLTKLNYGQTKPGLNLSQIMSIQIPKPSKESVTRHLEKTNLLLDIMQENKQANKEISLLFRSVVSQGFSGQLTAIWRERHIAELREAARQRDEQPGKRTPQPAITTQKETNTPFKFDESHPRYFLLRDLSDEQHRLFQVAQNIPGYFSPHRLVEDNGWDLERVQRGLSLLVEAGLLVRVHVPINPGERGVIYRTAYRALREDEKSSKIRENDLAAIYAAYTDLKPE